MQNQNISLTLLQQWSLCAWGCIKYLDMLKGLFPWPAIIHCQGFKKVFISVFWLFSHFFNFHQFDQSENNKHTYYLENSVCVLLCKLYAQGTYIMDIWFYIYVVAYIWLINIKILNIPVPKWCIKEFTLNGGCDLMYITIPAKYWFF